VPAGCERAEKISARAVEVGNLSWGLLPIEWVIFRNSDVMAVFDDDTLADRWSLLGVAPRRDECARRPD